MHATCFRCGSYSTTGPNELEALCDTCQDELASTQTTIETLSGRRINYLNPIPNQIHIGDIAAGLSKLCRFGGQCGRFYSVAEHSILCSQVVPPYAKLQALLHDAMEAYVCDVPRPLKRLIHGYKDVEARLWKVIARKYGVDEVLYPEVKDADDSVLIAERIALFPTPMDTTLWTEAKTPAPVKVVGHLPEVAEKLFLAEFKRLTGEHQ